MKLLADPRLFNYIIMSLYAGAVIRWSIAEKWTNAAYWLGALIITLAVTFGYQK